MTIPRSNGVVCITDYTRRAVAALARQTWVVPNAVDSAFFDLPVNQTSDGPPAILCVGNVGLRKNQNAFIRALDPVAARSAFRLIFLGQLDAASSYGAEFLELVRDPKMVRLRRIRRPRQTPPLPAIRRHPRFAFAGR